MQLFITFSCLRISSASIILRVRASWMFLWKISPGGGGRVLPYMGYIGMCRCEGYGFPAVYSSIGYINHSVWV